VLAANVNSTTFAPNAIGTIFGSRLATETAQASAGDLPFKLGGTRVLITDPDARREALLIYVSPTQINFALPGDVTQGATKISVEAGDGAQGRAQVQIARVSPGLFTLNAAGLVAASVLRVSADGSRTAEDIYTVDGSGAIVARPIDLGPATDQVFLIAYGTGFRGAAGATVNVGGSNATVQFSGAQGFFFGLDQANVLLSRSLAGRGDVTMTLTVGGATSNTVHLTIR
jgi:uncharacterized protein (TIGR03437 family)